MDAPGTVERAALQAAATATMWDTCHIGTATGTSWGASAGGNTWTYGVSEVVCGVNPAKSREVMDNAQTTLTDCEIRLPFGTAVTSASRIKVTKRGGVSLAADEIYAVVGAPRVGPSAVVCACKRVTGSSLA